MAHIRVSWTFNGSTLPSGWRSANEWFVSCDDALAAAAKPFPKYCTKVHVTDFGAGGHVGRVIAKRKRGEVLRRL